VPDYIRQEVAAQQVRLYLAQGILAAAQMILEAHGFSYQDAFTFPHLPQGPITHSLGLLYNSSLRVLLHQAWSGEHTAHLAHGIQLADRLIARARRERFLFVELEALLLRAQMRGAETINARGHGAKDLAAGKADYVSALELGQPQGIIGIFLDQEPPLMEALVHLLKTQQLPDRLAAQARRILDAYERLPAPSAIWPAQPPATPWNSGEIEAGPQDDADSMVEPLTDREREVLALIARGLTYKEIAEELVISLNTVRFHVKAVYGKLNVHRRAQAVQKARQRHIL
jgi:LuxR family maltose regulon positive regulatory protein